MSHGLHGSLELPADALRRASALDHVAGQTALEADLIGGEYEQFRTKEFAHFRPVQGEESLEDHIASGSDEFLGLRACVGRQSRNVARGSLRPRPGGAHARQ